MDISHNFRDIALYFLGEAVIFAGLTYNAKKRLLQHKVTSDRPLSGCQLFILWDHIVVSRNFSGQNFLWGRGSTAIPMSIKCRSLLVIAIQKYNIHIAKCGECRVGGARRTP